MALDGLPALMLIMADDDHDFFLGEMVMEKQGIR
jgi:hypothetical protein